MSTIVPFPTKCHEHCDSARDYAVTHCAVYAVCHLCGVYWAIGRPKNPPLHDDTVPAEYRCLDSQEKLT